MVEVIFGAMILSLVIILAVAFGIEPHLERIANALEEMNKKMGK